MNEQVLIVDDDANLLDSCRRQLRGQFSITTTLSPESGLELLESESYAVVMADMQMPGMNGVEFLQLARNISPDSVRMMLTGDADQQTATSAINQASVYRFLNKPCPVEQIAAAISEALLHFRVTAAEKELLEKTVVGSVKMLTDILSMLSPAAFGRATRVSRLVKTLCRKIGVNSPWEVEMAAMLSQLGCVTIPEAVIEKANRGLPLTGDELEMFANQRRLATELISNIPRLEPVVQLIRRVSRNGSLVENDGASPAQVESDLAVAVLDIAFDFVDADSRASGTFEAFNEIRLRAERYEPDVLLALESVLPGCDTSSARKIKYSELQPGQILAAEVLSATGQVLVGKHQEVTRSLMHRLKNFAATQTILEPLYVLISTPA